MHVERLQAWKLSSDPGAVADSIGAILDLVPNSSPQPSLRARLANERIVSQISQQAPLRHQDAEIDDATGRFAKLAVKAKECLENVRGGNTKTRVIIVAGGILTGLACFFGGLWFVTDLQKVISDLPKLRIDLAKLCL